MATTETNQPLTLELFERAKQLTFFYKQNPEYKKRPNIFFSHPWNKANPRELVAKMLEEQKRVNFIEKIKGYHTTKNDVKLLYHLAGGEWTFKTDFVEKWNKMRQWLITAIYYAGRPIIWNDEQWIDLLYRIKPSPSGISHFRISYEDFYFTRLWKVKLTTGGVAYLAGIVTAKIYDISSSLPELVLNDEKTLLLTFDMGLAKHVARKLIKEHKAILFDGPEFWEIPDDINEKLLREGKLGKDPLGYIKPTRKYRPEYKYHEFGFAIAPYNKIGKDCFAGEILKPSSLTLKYGYYGKYPNPISKIDEFTPNIIPLDNFALRFLQVVELARAFEIVMRYTDGENLIKFWAEKFERNKIEGKYYNPEILRERERERQIYSKWL
jgi:hypothetical protein